MPSRLPGARLKSWQATRRQSPPPPLPPQQQHFAPPRDHPNPPVPRASDYVVTLPRPTIAEQRVQPLYFNRHRAKALVCAHSRPTAGQQTRTEIASYWDWEITRLRADLGHRGLIEKGSKAEVYPPPPQACRTGN